MIGICVCVYVYIHTFVGCSREIKKVILLSLYVSRDLEEMMAGPMWSSGYLG